MDWKEEFDEKFKLQTKSNNAYIQNISELIIDIKDYIENLLAEERNKVEALIKEEKQNTAREIFDEIENNWITDIDIELLRENYKGVE